MGRSIGSVNKSYYHYSVTDNTDVDKPILKKYKTMEDIGKDFGVSKRLLYYKIKNGANYTGKFKHLEIKKIKEPAYKLISI